LAALPSGKDQDKRGDRIRVGRHDNRATLRQRGDRGIHSLSHRLLAKHLPTEV